MQIRAFSFLLCLSPQSELAMTFSPHNQLQFLHIKYCTTGVSDYLKRMEEWLRWRSKVISLSFHSKFRSFHFWIIRSQLICTLSNRSNPSCLSSSLFTSSACLRLQSIIICQIIPYAPSPFHSSLQLTWLSILPLGMCPVQFASSSSTCSASIDALLGSHIRNKFYKNEKSLRITATNNQRYNIDVLKFQTSIWQAFHYNSVIILPWILIYKDKIDKQLDEDH